MNLTAHPYLVAAEVAWKQESLGHSHGAEHRRPRRRRAGWHLPGSLGGARRPRRQPQRPRPA
jgi:hypothetical protein